MSSSQIAFSTPKDGSKVNATKATRPAIDSVNATEPVHPAPSFAKVLATTPAPKKAKAPAREMTQEQKPPKAKAKKVEMTEEQKVAFKKREENRVFVEEQKKAGCVIAVFNIFPTKKDRESAADGEKPRPKGKNVTHKLDSVREAIPGCKIRVTTREDEQIYKVCYVSIPDMPAEDFETFCSRPLQVTEKKMFPQQQWTSTIELKLHSSCKPVERATAKFAQAPDPLVDVNRYADGLPGEFKPGMRMPRCYGALWNVPPGSPHGKAVICAKSGKGRDGKDKGPCKWNLAIVDALLKGEKTPHGWCKYDHRTIADAGFTTPEAYELLKQLWLKDSARMRKHDEERKAKEAAKVARAERRTAAKVAAEPDSDGFRKGKGKAKRATEAKRTTEATLLPPSSFAALAVEDSESGSEDEVEAVPQPDTCARPDPAELEPEEDDAVPVKLSKKERQARNRAAKKGTKLLLDA